MKHDETNFDANSPNRPVLDAELEARVVAWVAGEVSADEAAALEKLAAENPAVREFQREMEAVQGLVAEGMRADAEPLRLADGRREKLLAALSAPRTGAAPVPLRERIATLPKQLSWWSWRGPRLYFMGSSLAAACLVGLFLYQDKRSRSFAEMDSPRDSMAVGTDRAPTTWARVNASARPASGEPAVRDLAVSLPPVPEKFVDLGLARARGTAVDGRSRGRSGGAAADTAGAKPAAAQETTTLAFADTIGGAAGPALRRSAAPPLSEPFVVAESREAFGATAAMSAANTQPIMPALPPVTTGFQGSFIAEERSTLEARAAATLPPPGLADEKKAEGVAQTAVAGFAPFVQAVEAEKKDVIRLDAFTVSSPPRSKEGSLAASVGRVFSSAASTFAPAAPTATGEIATAQEPISTFSLHVSDVSFRLATAAVAAMARGENVPEPKVRAEEFYNAFDYGDPSPTPAEKIATRIEQSAHPFLQQRNFVRIAMKVAATGRSAAQPLRLTVLLDTSGSMEREDRAAAVRRALEVLVSLLGPNDRLTVIGFARQPRLIAENLPGDQARFVIDLIARTPAEGGTNIEAALKLGGELARRHLSAGAQNRIVVLTDGAANLGDAEPARLTAAVETLRQQGIAFDACGVGLEGTGDTILEALTRKGNGRYYALDSAETADASFARQLAGAFRPAAENVKLQVRFNPSRVGRYRLIGFEAHRLRTEDFRNDAIDAAELAAEEAAVALYQVEVLPQGTGEIGEVFVRFRDAATGEMVERSWSIPFEARVPAFNRATPSLRLAGVAALLAEKFLETPLADQFKLGDLAPTVNALRSEYAQQPRVQELLTMFNQMRQLTRE